MNLDERTSEYRGLTNFFLPATVEAAVSGFRDGYRAANEDAAKVCDNEQHKGDCGCRECLTAVDCRDKVRALVTPQSPPQTAQ